jgi:nicotinate-nucleotide pyrophosphorylase (carboxylating)
MNEIDRIIRTALAEDIGWGDITTRACIEAGSQSRAELVAKEDFVLAGIDVAAQVFVAVDTTVSFEKLREDGRTIRRGEVFAWIKGASASLLQGERVALNLLRRMSGIATLTGLFVEAVDGTGARIVDTRKTTPGLRYLEKYAVRAGGGQNHRYALCDGILIKENHIHAAGGVTAAIQRAKLAAPHTIKVEVETTTLAEVEEALLASADIILLDNMTLDELRQAVKLVDGRALTEASGGVNLKSVRAIAETGVDLISVGALTHSFRSIDISLLFR